ncbi:MAG TPA: MarR family transcriptional regulator [Miltoncostaeaceae bacterium]|nr:MarR family transcriptional regulator [Miltoncostaeaceae bacterium]
MADAPSPAQVVAALQRFGRERERLRAALARTLGVAGADLDALAYLENEGPMSQRDLGDRLLLTSGAITTLVDRLARAGWVRRHPHPHDRRSVLVALTEEGEREVHPVLAAFDRALGDAARALPAAARADALRLLAAVGDAAADAVRSLPATDGRAARRAPVALS